jgi:hypothetical protein
LATRQVNQRFPNYSRGGDFESANLFGQLLYPAKMNAEFAAVRTDFDNAFPGKSHFDYRNDF